MYVVAVVAAVAAAGVAAVEAAVVAAVAAVVAAAVRAAVLAAAAAAVGSSGCRSSCSSGCSSSSSSSCPQAAVVRFLVACGWRFRAAEHLVHSRSIERGMWMCLNNFFVRSNGVEVCWQDLRLEQRLVPGEAPAAPGAAPAPAASSAAAPAARQEFRMPASHWEYAGAPPGSNMSPQAPLPTAAKVQNYILRIRTNDNNRFNSTVSSSTTSHSNSSVPIAYA